MTTKKSINIPPFLDHGLRTDPKRMPFCSKFCDNFETDRIIRCGFLLHLFLRPVTWVSVAISIIFFRNEELRMILLVSCL